MSSNIKNEISVGLLFIVGMAILGYYTIIMVDKFVDYKSVHKIVAAFDHVEGLERSHEVKVKGVVSGNVESVVLDGERVVVTMNMQYNIALYENYEIFIKTPLALGEPYVSIDPGKSINYKGKAMALINTESILRGTLNSPMDVFTDLITENRSDIRSTIKNIKEITDKINKGKGTVGKLINKDEVHAQTDELVKELRDTIEDAREQAPVTSFIRAALTMF